MKKSCNFIFSDMVKNIPFSLVEDNLQLCTIRRYFRMTRDYQRLYANNFSAAEAVKKVKEFKSHRSPLFSEYQNFGGKVKPWEKNKEARESWLKEKLATDVDATHDLHEDSVSCVEPGSEQTCCDEEEGHDVLYELIEDYNSDSDIELS